MLKGIAFFPIHCIKDRSFFEVHGECLSTQIHLSGWDDESNNFLSFFSTLIYLFDLFLPIHNQADLLNTNFLQQENGLLIEFFLV